MNALTVSRVIIRIIVIIIIILILNVMYRIQESSITNICI